MGWTYLLLAGLFEVVWATSLKHSGGFSRLGPSLVTLAAMAVSIYFLALAMKSLPLGTAYPVWTGIGAIGSVLVGIALFGEARTALRLFWLALIVIGILGLRASSGE